MFVSFCFSIMLLNSFLYVVYEERTNGVVQAVNPFFCGSLLVLEEVRICDCECLRKWRRNIFNIA